MKFHHCPHFKKNGMTGNHFYWLHIKHLVNFFFKEAVNRREKISYHSFSCDEKTNFSLDLIVYYGDDL